MKEHPILFSGAMIRAILDGRKTQTRRIVNPQPCVSVPGQYADLYNHEPNHWAFWLPDNRMTEPRIWSCKFGVVGDHLWVRETHFVGQPAPDDYPQIAYRADMAEHATDGKSVCPAKNHYPSTHKGPWTPAIHMPRWASRITLEVAGVRVERLQEISEADAKAEGIDRIAGDGWAHPYALGFRAKWDEINGSRADWVSNPWVWVVSFRRVQP